MPNTYHAYQNAEKDLKNIQNEVIRFIKKFEALQQGINFSKFSELAPLETRNKIESLRKKAKQQERIVNGILSQIKPRHSHTGGSLNNYEHGSYGRLFGQYNPLRKSLRTMINHLDFLLNTENSVAKKRNSIASMASGIEHISKDLKQLDSKTGANGMALLFGIAAMLIIAFDRLKNKNKR